MPRKNVVEFIYLARDKTARAMKGVQKNLKTISKEVVTVNRALAAAFATGVMFRFGESVANAGDNVRNLEQQLKLLSKTNRAAFESNIKVADELGMAFADTAKTYSRFLIATQALGSSVADVELLTDSVFKLGRIGGSSIEEIKNTSLQLGQGLAAGALQGDELRSVLENMPLLAGLIAEEMGVATGQLKKLGSEGKITAEIVEKAILKNAEKINDQFDQLPRTLAQSKAALGNEWGLLLSAMDRTLAASETFQFFTASIGDAISGFRRLLGDTSNDELRRAKVNELVAERLELEKKLEYLQRKQGVVTSGDRMRINRAQGRVDEINAEIAELQLIRKEIEIERNKKREVDSGSSTTETGTPDKPDYSRDIALQEEYADAERAREEMWAQFDVDWDNRETERVNKSESRWADYYRTLDSITDQAARNMQDAFADFLFDPFEDGLQGMLSSFIDVIRRMVAEAAAAQIFASLGLASFLPAVFGGGGSGGGSAPSFGGRRASGGPAYAGKTYLVGERGPELVTMGGNGFVHPNGAGGINAVYNIDARGASSALVDAFPAILERNNAYLLAEVDKRSRQRGGM